MNNIISLLIKSIPYFLYVLLLFGISLVIWKSVADYFSINKKKKEKKKKDAFYELLEFHYGNKAEFAKKIVLLLIAIIFAFAWIILLGVQIKLRIVISTCFSLLPVLVLYLRRILFRVDGSHEGLEVLTELTNQYKINNFDIIEALDKTVFNLKKSPHSKKALFRLTTAIKEANNEEELLNELDVLNKTINTEWMNILSNNIYIALIDKKDIAVGLEDILAELKDAKVRYERSNRLNLEGLFIAVFVMPISYIVTALISMSMFGNNLNDFMNLQFNSYTGVKNFIIIVLIYISNLVLAYLFKRRRFDI